MTHLAKVANVDRTIASALLASLAALTACSGGGSAAGTPDGSASGGFVTQTGRMVQYLPCTTSLSAVPGATITIGSHTATSAMDGTYSILVPSGTPFTMTAIAPDYVQLIEAADTVTANYDRGDTKMILSDTATLLSAGLPNYDQTKALLTIDLVKTGSCADLGGTTVSVSPADANALTQYPASCGSPVGTDAFATDGIFPGAVVYNLTPGTQTISAKSPKCTPIPYPYTDPTTGLTYDGSVTTQAGTGTSFTRVFFK